MNQDHFAVAKARLLDTGSLQDTDIARLLGQLSGSSIDYADLYFQHSQQESWYLEDGRVRDGNFSIEQGCGARAIAGEATGFAYSDELKLPALEFASKTARAIARSGQDGQQPVLHRAEPRRYYSPTDPITSMSSADKVQWMRKIDAHARSSDPRVSQVMVSLAATQDIILVAATDGTMAADVRPLVRLNVQVLAEHNDRRETGMAGMGGRYDVSDLFTEDKAFDLANEAVRQALLNLEAIDAPAGTMPVILGSGWPGVLLHEAVGHGLEADFNRKGTSAFSGKMGQMVASPACTVVDDGAMEGRRGSLNVDDEGVETGATTLIENGRLVGYMQDKLSARLTGQKPTGNGRRESFAHLPMPRMTNTFMRAGEHDPEEIIASVDRGLYAVNFGGGQVDITSGKFVFSASEAYLIENGKVGAPVKGATLIGDGAQVMQSISMVGNDLALDPGIGVCGKEGQSVPVGVGQPTIKIDALTVGGTQSE